jgi:hypothetical protein
LPSKAARIPRATRKRLGKSIEKRNSGMGAAQFRLVAAIRESGTGSSAGARNLCVKADSSAGCESQSATMLPPPRDN